MTNQSVRTLLTMLAVVAAMTLTPINSETAEAADHGDESRTVVITGMRKVIDGLTPDSTGTFQSWDGTIRAW